jgi:hypothetical protein
VENLVNTILIPLRLFPICLSFEFNIDKGNDGGVDGDYDNDDDGDSGCEDEMVVVLLVL